MALLKSLIQARLGDGFKALTCKMEGVGIWRNTRPPVLALEWLA